MRAILASLALTIVSTKLIIQSPEKLVNLFQEDQYKKHNVGVIKASYANFGFVPYGHTMVSGITL